MVYDAIVIGAGSMGSATAYHLAKRGGRVLCLEQFNIGHDLGSAHGVNRIIRLAYAEHPAYVPLLRRAYALWREIERTAKERLLFITGGIDAGPEDGEIFRGSLASCLEHGLKHEVLSSAELTRRFPGFRLPKSMKAVYQSDGGFVLSERAVIAYITAAQALGAEIHAREAVRQWEVKRGRVIVETDKGKYTAAKLVITAGAWASKLVPSLRKRKLAVPERQVLIWAQPRHPELFRLGAFPVFNMEVHEEGEVNRYYGTPIYGVPGFKLGKYHHRKQKVDPDRMDRKCHPEDEAVLRAAIRRYFPDANGPTMAMRTCLFTNSPDEHFILDAHPEFPQVAIAAGFSGHGFKFASVVGEIMAGFAMMGGSRWLENLDLFKIGRKR
ncbi:MAG: N-methyl-L-tryptophan oxidase [Bryobacterales bacterium]|nr:N-methyl-L-tryptophan oxidase [Bryobacterales bacterium]